MSKYHRIARIAANDVLKAWHGTSDIVLEQIHEDGGLRNPYLAASDELASYYAEEAAADAGGEPVILEVIVRDTSKLRLDSAAMDEPVKIGIDEEDRWDRAAKEHPEWVHNDMIIIPAEEWEYSWEAVHSVRYDGLLPLADIS